MSTTHIAEGVLLLLALITRIVAYKSKDLTERNYFGIISDVFSASVIVIVALSIQISDMKCKCQCQCSKPVQDTVKITQPKHDTTFLDGNTVIPGINPKANEATKNATPERLSR